MSIIDNPLFNQIINNVALLLISLLLVSLIQKGFFWKFFRVKISFGKLVLIKIRAVNRDHFAVGQVIDDFLVHKTKTGAKRFKIPSSEIFYRVLGTAWCDYDEKTGAFVKPDFSAVSGFDPEAFDNLFIRTLFRPAENDAWKKTVIGLLIGILVIVGIVGFIAFLDYRVSQQMVQFMAEIRSSGIVVPK